MAISAKQVKELREKTGAGMLDCKKALEACDGDQEKAFDWLREKGIAKAAKKASRIAAEGLSTYVIEGNKCAVVEVNSETDFVAKNDEFKQLVNFCAELCVKNDPADLTAALALEAEEGKTLETYIAEKTGKIGEKLSFRRFVVLTKEDSDVFGAYSHGGKITSVVVIANSEDEKAKNVAMQLASMKPNYMDKDSVPAEDLKREMDVQINIMKEDPKMATKPQNILEKIVAGKMGKFYKENCLTEQAFIMDDSMSVQQYLGKGKVKEIVRFEVGEGMQKREENFAEEVAKQMA